MGLVYWRIDRLGLQNANQSRDITNASKGFLHLFSRVHSRIFSRTMGKVVRGEALQESYAADVNESLQKLVRSGEKVCAVQRVCFSLTPIYSRAGVRRARAPSKERTANSGSGTSWNAARMLATESGDLGNRPRFRLFRCAPSSSCYWPEDVTTAPHRTILWPIVARLDGSVVCRMSGATSLLVSFDPPNQLRSIHPSISRVP